MKPSTKVTILVAVVLLIDQVVKVWIKTHYEIGGGFNILGLPWAQIHFVENNGMAFGLTLGGNYGKLALSVFRLIAIGFLVYLIRQFLQAKVGFGILFSFGLILSGAIGNILDSAFYGMLFSESTAHLPPARLFPAEGGYAGFLHGKVVDMFHFPIARGIWPDWVPWLGGRYYMFFQPVFNIADIAITAGVLNILLFQRSFFFQEIEKKDAVVSEENPAAEEANPSSEEE